MKYIVKVLFSLVTLIISTEQSYAQQDLNDITWIEECYRPILHRSMENSGFRGEDLNLRWAQTQACLFFVGGNQSDSLDIYGYNLKTTKKLLTQLIGRSKKIENPEISAVLSYIDKVNNDDLNASEYGPMVDKTIFNRDNTKLDKSGIKLALSVLNKLIRTEIEFEIISKIAQSIYDLDTDDVYIGDGARCGFGLKKMELTQADISLLTNLGMHFVVSEGLSDLGRIKEWKSDKQRLFATCFFSYRNYIHQTKQQNTEHSWASFTNLYKQDFEWMNDYIDYGLYEYLDNGFQAKDIDIKRFVNATNLVKFFMLWNLEKSGITKVLIPNEYEKDGVFAEIKSTYPSLNEVRMTDFKDYMIKNIESSGKSKLQVSYSFYDCLSDYIESIPRLSRPSYEDDRYEIPNINLVDLLEPTFLDLIQNYSSVDIKLRQEREGLFINIDDKISKLDSVEKKFKENLVQEDKLTMDEMNKQNKKKELLSQHDDLVRFQRIVIERLLPVFFDDPQQFKNFLAFYREENKKDVNLMISEHRKRASSNLDDSYSPDADSIITNLVYSSPFSKKIISELINSKSEMTKAFGQEMEKVFKDYENSIQKLAKIYTTRLKPVVDRYNERFSKPESRFKNLKEYFTASFDAKQKNQGTYRERFNGLTNYSVNRDWSNRIQGEVTFFWDNLNYTEIESTLNLPGSGTVKVNLIGKIIKNNDPKSNKEWPYVFVVEKPVGSSGDKFYIRFEDMKCSSNIEFAGDGRSKNIFFTFGIIL